VFGFIALTGRVFGSGPSIDVRWTWLQLPVLIGLLVVLALGVALLLSVLYIRFRDIKPIWQVVLQALFYLTPILYPVEAIRSEYPEALKFVMCNPLAAINQQVRYAVIDPTAPTAAAAIGETAMLIVPLAIIAALFVAGIVCFARLAPGIAEDL
jgi:ABC-2 type transport system permease protein